MKLAQRIAIGYYRTRIKALALVSLRRAAEKTFELFCTPYSGKPKRKVPPIFHHAEQLNIEINGMQSRGWRWAPESFNGKRILIVHGFDSCSYKFEKYVHPLNKLGFEVLAFDAIAHGTSDGKTINAPMYRQSIMDIDRKFGPLHGIMAHSLGGLAASLAAEQMPHLKKLVLIAPATETQTAIDNFFRFTKLPGNIKEEMEAYIVEFGGNPIPYYSVPRALSTIQTPVLWLHDEEDPICTFEDVKPAMAKGMEHVTFHITKGLGHSKIYRDNEVMKTIAAFMSTG